jgi:hypothetical protein
VINGGRPQPRTATTSEITIYGWSTKQRKGTMLGRYGALAVPLFVGSYLAVWTLVGVAVYALYRPHGSLAASAVAIAARVYEITPLKQYFRGRCREALLT